MPVQGIDVSYWQGDIDWQKVDDAGVRFAYIKATEGGDRLDPKFSRQLAGAPSRPASPAAPIISCIGARPAARAGVVVHAERAGDRDALPPVLDLEWNSDSKTCPHHMLARHGLAKIKIMLEAMEAHTGKRPIIYTDPKFHRDVLEGEFTNYQFWLRSVAASPAAKYRARNWAFWQFTTTGACLVLQAAVDRNSFNGTSAIGSAC